MCQSDTAILVVSIDLLRLLGNGESEANQSIDHSPFNVLKLFKDTIEVPTKPPTRIRVLQGNLTMFHRA